MNKVHQNRMAERRQARKAAKIERIREEIKFINKLRVKHNLDNGLDSIED